jgi:hypothetical protein
MSEVKQAELCELFRTFSSYHCPKIFFFKNFVAKTFLFQYLNVCCCKYLNQNQLVTCGNTTSALIVLSEKLIWVGFGNWSENPLQNFLNISPIRMRSTEQVGSSGETSDLYSGGAQF